MDASTITCELHSSNFLVVDKDFKVYCFKCCNDKSTDNSKNQSNLAFIDKHINVNENSSICKTHFISNEFFCLSCKDFICRDCICTTHKEHDAGTFSQISNKIIKVLKEKKESYINNINTIEKNSLQFDESTKKISQFTDNIKQKIKSSKQKYLNQISENLNEKTNSLNKKKEELEELFYNIKEKLIKNKENLIKLYNLKLNEAYITLSEKLTSNFSQCLFVKDNYSLIKPCFDYIYNSNDNKNEEFSAMEKKLNKSYNEYFLLFKEVLDYYTKFEQNINSSLNTNIPCIIYKLNRFNKYEFSSVYVKHTNLSFEVNKEIKLCGISLCAVKNIPKSGFNSKLTSSTSLNINSLSNIKKNINDSENNVNFKLRLFEHNYNINNNRKSINTNNFYENDILLDTIESELKQSLNSNNNNNLISYYFNNPLLIKKNQAYSINVELNSINKDSYLEICIGNNLDIIKDNNSKCLSVVSNNISDLVFTFDNGRLESDLYEDSKGIIAEIIYSSAE